MAQGGPGGWPYIYLLEILKGTFFWDTLYLHRASCNVNLRTIHFRRTSSWQTPCSWRCCKNSTEYWYYSEYCYLKKKKSWKWNHPTHPLLSTSAFAIISSSFWSDIPGLKNPDLIYNPLFWQQELYLGAFWRMHCRKLWWYWWEKMGNRHRGRALV